MQEFYSDLIIEVLNIGTYVWLGLEYYRNFFQKDSDRKIINKCTFPILFKTYKTKNVVKINELQKRNETENFIFEMKNNKLFFSNKKESKYRNGFPLYGTMTIDGTDVKFSGQILVITFFFTFILAIYFSLPLFLSTSKNIILIRTIGSLTLGFFLFFWFYNLYNKSVLLKLAAYEFSQKLNLNFENEKPTVFRLPNFPVKSVTAILFLVLLFL